MGSSTKTRADTIRDMSHRTSEPHEAPDPEGEAPPLLLPDSLPPSTSFARRVARFWDWFELHAARLRGDVSSSSLDATRFGEAIHACGLPLAWEFFRTQEEGKEGFALSGDGVRTDALLARYAIERAAGRTDIEAHFSLSDVKQPTEGLASATVDISKGEPFAFADFLFGVDFDPEEERLVLDVHHPRFADLPEGARWQLSWLALDGALGEALVTAWVGEVSPLTEKGEMTRHGIDALRRQARAALEVHDLDPDVDPLSVYVSYERRQVEDGDLVPRGDVLAGASMLMAPIEDLGRGEEEDLRDRSGASLCYVALRADALGPPEDRVETRVDLQDAIETNLAMESMGLVLGGATGAQYSYIDLMLFDEERGLELTREALAENPEVAPAVARFFSGSRGGEQIELLGDWEAPPPGYAP